MTDMYVLVRLGSAQSVCQQKWFKKWFGLLNMV